MMLDPTDRSLEEALARVVSDSAGAAMHCLAAAERAVNDGRFNIAKVLRACAHSTRLTALTAARLRAQDSRPAEMLASALALLEQQSLEMERVRTLLLRHRGTAAMRPHTLRDVRPGSADLEDILRRALRSLQGNRDVLENDVAQSLWGCQVCGAVVEGPAPQNCRSCGAFGFEFEWFGPFYSGTFERLGRHSPAEIAGILKESPLRLANLLDGVDEDRLATRPSVDEWCMKEIAGHLIDVTHLFSSRVRTIRDRVTPPSPDGSLPPWRLLEGKGYPDIASPLIVQGFRKATQEALEIVEGLGVEDWGRFGLVRGRVTTILDLGTWLANHNIAHCAQIEALRRTTQGDR
jgi:rubrerythrin